MKLHPFDLFRSPSLFHNNRNKIRWMEWFIAILFIVTLLIGSGIFIKASNAASLKTRHYKGLSYNDVTTIPGSLRILKEKEQKPSSVNYIESEDSCELKIKS